MSNRNKYATWRGASGSQEYSAEYPGGDSGSYGQHGYSGSGPSAPRGTAEGVGTLEGDFGNMNLQDSHDPYAYSSYSHSHYPPSHEGYGQSPQYDESPLDPAHGAPAKSKSSKSKQKSSRDNTKEKGSRKSHSKKTDKHSGYSDSNSEPFYARPQATRSQTDAPYSSVVGQQNDFQQSDDSTSYSGRGQEYGSANDVYMQTDHSGAPSGQDYQQEGYQQVDSSQEDYLETPQEHQQGSYSHDNFSNPISGQGHKHKGKQRERREQQADEDFPEGDPDPEEPYPHDPYREASTAEPGYHQHQAQDEGAYYPEEPEGYQHPRNQEPANYHRSYKSKDAKSTSGKRSKRESRRDYNSPPRDEIPLEYPPDELQAAMAGADGYDAGGHYPAEFPSSHHDRYYEQKGHPTGDDDESGQQTPKPGTPSVGIRSATMPLAAEAAPYDPYQPDFTGSYPTTDDHSAYENASSGYGAAYGQGLYQGYPDYEQNLNDPGSSSTYGNNYDTIAAVDDAGTSGELDGRYVVEHSSRFGAGEVFKVLWSEPRGSGRGDAPATEFMEGVHMGQTFYMGIRRFIVVANDEGHCTCVPILTYERRACTKKGVKPHKHGIVYTPPAEAKLLRGEPPLGFPPVRLQLDYPTEKLSMESRVNYSKLVTIEHNVKVFFIGRVYQDDFRVVDQAVDRCWSEKNRNTDGHRDHRDHRRRDRR